MAEPQLYFFQSHSCLQEVGRMRVAQCAEVRAVSPRRFIKSQYADVNALGFHIDPSGWQQISSLVPYASPSISRFLSCSLRWTVSASSSSGGGRYAWAGPDRWRRIRSVGDGSQEHTT